VKRVELGLGGACLIEAPVYADDRGFFTEVFHRATFAELGLPTEWPQDNHSRSVRGTVRGLHYQLRAPQGKLVRVVCGVIDDVIVDVRRGSATLGEHRTVRLEAGDGRQLWVPPGFAHGFLVLSERADVCYKCTTVYDPLYERAVAWNDPALGIDWRLAGHEARLSPKDRAAPLLADAELLP
jgi:dTDP-4-dehydrorhamnose 3,5-epimerase